MANSGLTLPAIKPGSEVRDIATPSPSFEDDAHFIYEKPDGQKQSVAVYQFSKESAGDATSVSGFAHSLSLLTAGSNEEEPGMSHVNRDTGREVSVLQTPLPGTVKGTIEKVFKCRDPKIS